MAPIQGRPVDGLCLAPRSHDHAFSLNLSTSEAVYASLVEKNEWGGVGLGGGEGGFGFEVFQAVPGEVD